MLKRLTAWLAVILVGLAGAFVALWAKDRYGNRGRAPVSDAVRAEWKCAPWDFPLAIVRAGRFAYGQREWRRRLAAGAKDGEADLLRVNAPHRAFWIKPEGEEMDGAGLLAYLLAEHEWMEGINESEQVKRGDTVIDCGAHVGVFTDYALRRGASKVISVEPEPVNAAALRRTFAKEIAEGRVIVAENAAWNAETTLDFTLSTQNSGGNSAVMFQGGRKISVRAVRLDTLMRELGIAKVDYIKMDIEGAEREALKGAEEVLKRDKPRLMVEFYHLADDPEVLPKIILGARPDYRQVPGPVWKPENGDCFPYVMYYR